jgi:hypothetical protein
MLTNINFGKFIVVVNAALVGLVPALPLVPVERSF